MWCFHHSAPITEQILWNIKSAEVHIKHISIPVTVQTIINLAILVQRQVIIEDGTFVLQRRAQKASCYRCYPSSLITLQRRKFVHWLPLATLTMTNCSIFREEENNNCFWHINHSIQRIITSYIHSIKALNWKLTGRALCEKSFSCQSDALSFLLLTHKCNPSVPLRYLVHNTSVLCYNVQHCLQPINFCVTNIMWKVKDAITKYKI